MDRWDNPDRNEIEFNPRKGSKYLNQMRNYEAAESEDKDARITGSN